MCVWGEREGRLGASGALDTQTHPHQHGQYSKINLYASNLIGGGGSQKLRTAYTHVVVVSMVSQEEVQRVTQQQLQLNFSHGDVAVCVCVCVCVSIQWGGPTAASAESSRWTPSPSSGLRVVKHDVT